MAKGRANKGAEKRIKVKNLPSKAKTLTTKEAKTVKGGVLEDPYILIANKSPKPLKNQ
jgi:hypothetical protein